MDVRCSLISEVHMSASRKDRRTSEAEHRSIEMLSLDHHHLVLTAAFTPVTALAVVETVPAVLLMSNSSL
jgi:hypothetical protein